jgi:hypothetical protein
VFNPCFIRGLENFYVGKIKSRSLQGNLELVIEGLAIQTWDNASAVGRASCGQ